MIYALGVDPGATSGWGLVVLAPTGRCRLVRSGQVCHLPYQAVLVELADVVPPVATRLMGIEGQWLPGDAARGDAHRAHAVDALETARSAGGWREAGLAAGWTVPAPIPPTTWRTAILGRHPRATRAEWKDLALWYVGRIHHMKLPRAQDHIAEAICIAEWVAGETRMRGC